MKAILEMLMPDTCLTCILADHEVDNDTEYLYCHALNKSVDEDGYLGRHKDCPLRAVRPNWFD